MGLTMEEKRKLTKMDAIRYEKAKKKEKGLILDNLTYHTGYNRCYAGYLLRQWGKKIKLKINNKEVVLIPDNRVKIKRKGKRKYDERVFNSLKNIWYIMDCICGKRLVSVLAEIISILEKFGEIEIDKSTRKKLLTISASTIDRLLSCERKSLMLKGRANTKPGTLLKHQIPIKTFSDWDDSKPGFVQIDLVSHEGGSASGDYAQTLDITDVATAWTETQAVRNKAQVWVFEALKDIEKKLPFKVLGIDSDNGSEFINAHLLRYCDENKITFTRGRPYKKNDLCFVEQKNYSVVRKAVGYCRYDTEQELNILNELYGYLRFYTNFFQPVMKLIEKTRIGSKVIKKYDNPKTPYQRVLADCHIPEENKDKLKAIYLTLNPAELKRKINKLQNKLFNLTILKEELRKKDLKHFDNSENILPETNNQFHIGLYTRT